MYHFTKSKPKYKQFFIYSGFFLDTSKSTGETGGITYRAATEERTGEVKEIRIRNDPEKTIRFWGGFTFSLTIFNSVTRKVKKTAKGQN